MEKGFPNMQNNSLNYWRLIVADGAWIDRPALWRVRGAMVDRSVGLAGAAFGEEVAAPVAGALVRGHGDAGLAGGGALGQEVVAGVDPRPAVALVAARLLRPCAR